MTLEASNPLRRARSVALLAAIPVVLLTTLPSRAQTTAVPTSVDAFANRGDIAHLPTALKHREIVLAHESVAYQPQTAFNEATGASQLFQYYNLDQNNFQPNVFSTGGSQSPPTIGAVRVVLEPKPGLPTDPNNVHAAIDTFTDIFGLPVLNNEADWYEAWMIHDLVVPTVAAARPDGHAQFGAITAADARMLARMGNGNNVPGNVFTMDGQSPRTGSVSDVYPNPARTPNVVPIQVSVGTFNGLQRGESHAYWEFNPGTDWVSPAFEIPSTGGMPGSYANGQQYSVQSLIPGDGPAGEPPNNKVAFGDNPNNPRNPENTAPTPAGAGEFRNRFIPSGLANEIQLDVFARPASFEAGVAFPQRLYDAYASEVARVDQNDDGVISFNEAFVDGSSDGLPNTRLYLPAPQFNRFAVTQEINDGLLAQRFAPSQRAYVLSGPITAVSPAVPASIPPPGGS